jgi:hypothetical protein
MGPLTASRAGRAHGLGTQDRVRKPAVKKSRTIVSWRVVEVNPGRVAAAAHPTGSALRSQRAR